MSFCFITIPYFIQVLGKARTIYKDYCIHKNKVLIGPREKRSSREYYFKKLRIKDYSVSLLHLESSSNWMLEGVRLLKGTYHELHMYMYSRSTTYGINICRMKCSFFYSLAFITAEL